MDPARKCFSLQCAEVKTADTQWAVLVFAVQEWRNRDFGLSGLAVLPFMLSAAKWILFPCTFFLFVCFWTLGKSRIHPTISFSKTNKNNFFTCQVSFQRVGFFVDATILCKILIITEVSFFFNFSILTEYDGVSHLSTKIHLLMLEKRASCNKYSFRI